MSARVLSLCSGYGGLDIAVEELFDAETVAHAEFELAPSRILAERWPGVPNLGDLTKVADWPDADIIAAGYPCQPDSLAGKGLSVDDHRWIFPDVARAISAVRPRLVVLENVPGHFVRGFRVVLGTLAELGFDAEWTLVRASDVGAPHKRERLFVIARNTNGMAGSEGEPFSGRRATLDEPRAVQRTFGPDSALVPDAHDDPARPGRTTRRQAERRSESAQHRKRTTTDADSDALRQQPIAEPGRSGQAVAGLACADAVADPDNRGRRSHESNLCTWKPDTGGGFAPDSDDDGLQGVRRIDTERRDPDRRSGADIAWGKYEPAIRRWERLTRPAPAPTEVGPKGGKRLSPAFVEWMMGLPPGWVTDVDISRNEQLKALGNGVVPQQAAEALRRLLVAPSERAA